MFNSVCASRTAAGLHCIAVAGDFFNAWPIWCFSHADSALAISTCLKLDRRLEQRKIQE